MIQPVNALTPKVLFKGGLKGSDASGKFRSEAEEKIALMNAGGISLAVGAAMTAISRSYTSNWKNAGLIGAGAAVIAMTFLVPTFLYKAASYPKQSDTDVFLKEKKLVDGKKTNLSSKIGTYSKNIIKKAV